MKFRRVVFNVGIESFVKWILNRQYYKPNEISLDKEFYVIDIRFINKSIPYLLFVAVDNEKYFADPDVIFLSTGDEHVEGDEGDEHNSDTEESDKVDDSPEVSMADQSEDPDADDRLFKRLAEDQQMMREIIYGPDYLLSQAFLISLALDKTEAYFVLYSEKIEGYVHSLIEEINSYWSVTVNEPISSTNWYQNYSFSTLMYPLEQNGLSDEELIEQMVPEKKKKHSKGKKGSDQSYNIPSNIYSNEITKYEWLSDYDYMKGFYKSFSLGTMQLIIKNFKLAYDKYQKEGGQWGPKKIADLLNLNATYVGRYIKALRDIGVLKIDEIYLPNKSRVKNDKNVKNMSKP